jgi:hypothetical protein
MVLLLFDYLLDFPIAIHSRVFVFDLAGDIELKNQSLRGRGLFVDLHTCGNLITKGQV